MFPVCYSNTTVICDNKVPTAMSP